ncbi:copper transport protein CCH-like [Dorcoceras hygrometricum]|uniref:Copper transport protein CCH-like n=1 Tax=Dorcoceras hygrometricum TaxID=472368 RepID=A0A2Z7D8D9_9LAMI|nr:copper transport protein CCH-like [Dorcoceras hygrometricum]
MSCQGCSGAVNRVLSKMEGVESFDINLEQQKVTVKGNVTPESVLQTVSKTGKAASFWEATEGKPEPVPEPNESGSKPAAA